MHCTCIMDSAAGPLAAPISPGGTDKLDKRHVRSCFLPSRRFPMMVDKYMAAEAALLCQVWMYSQASAQLTGVTSIKVIIVETIPT